jgi:pyrroloquinoline quinone (PQQ) biosynthesis protein C
MHTPTPDALSQLTTSTPGSSRLPRTTGERRELTTPEQQILHDVLECCERRFDNSVFFRRLAVGAMTPAPLQYVFGQYGHFRLQLHRWFAVCMILAKDASQPAQRQAILALADHVFTDLKDNHDLLFAEWLHQLGFPAGTLHAAAVSPATTTYIESFLDDCRRPTVTWLDAVAALGGRELSVALRNQRLLRSYFAPRGLSGPTWITLHADLEIDHFLDVVRPLLAEQGTTPLDSVRVAIDGALRRHVEYLDALLREHEEDTDRRTYCGG